MVQITKKGLIITISTIMLLSVAVLFAEFYAGNVSEKDSFIINSLRLDKAGFVKDDIACSLEKILGTVVDVNRGMVNTEIIFSDSLPSTINKAELLNYQSFVQSQYSSKQNSSILLDLNWLVDNRTELLFSNGMAYDYSYSGDSIIDFYVPGEDTNVFSYEITISVNDDLNFTAVWNWDAGGTIDVIINYSDNSNSFTDSGKLNADINNLYEIAYSETAGDSLLINIGEIDGNSSALKITESINDAASVAIVEITALMPSPSGGLFYYYAADLNYMQADVMVSGKMILGNA